MWKMNQTKRQSGESHTRFKEKGSSVPPDILELLSPQRGEGEKNGIEQMESMWSMLNEFHENDPCAYKDFIAQQARLMKNEVQIKHTDADEGDFSHRQLNPVKGFLVKGVIREDSARNKLFVNFCSHGAIELPTDDEGRTVKDDDDLHADKFHIPLLVSPLRPVADAKGRRALAVDVLLNQICIRKAQQCKVFCLALIRLCLYWVQRERKVNVELECWKLLKADYKGGTGPEGRDTLPFVIESIPSKGSATGRHPKASGIGTSVAERLRTPGDLIRSINTKNEPEPLDTIRTNCSDGPRKGQLIEEISVTYHAKKGKERDKTQRERKKPMATEMRGFLNRQSKRKSLYPSAGTEGGSSGLGGDCAKIMSRFKVIDTNNYRDELRMNNVEGRNNSIAKTKPTIPQHEGDNHSSSTVEKGVLTKAKNLAVLPTSNATARKSDVEFENIVAAGDPEIAATFAYADERHLCEVQDRFLNSLSAITTAVTRK